MTSLGDFGEMKADRDQLRAENARLQADFAAMKRLALDYDETNDRLRADLGHIRGFASIMDENNWRDCKLYISRQCDAAHEQSVYTAANGEELPTGSPGTTIVNDGRPT